MKSRTGRQILLDALLSQGVTTLFCGPEAPDSLPDMARKARLRVVCCRQEAAAGFMAEALGRLTGRAGVCYVRRGPGAAQAAVAVHMSAESSSPLLLLAEQVAAQSLGRGAAGEIDLRLMFGAPVAKWAVQADKARDLPRLLREALETAGSGRPGPVAVALPENVLDETSEFSLPQLQPPVHFGPRPNDLKRLMGLMAEAEKPLAIVGGGGWSADSSAAFAVFCASLDLPVLTGWGRGEVFPAAHDCYVGSLGPGADPALLARAAEADLLLAVGTRLGERTTQGYEFPALPEPKQRVIHVYPEASELNRVYPTALAIHAGVADFASALKTLPPHQTRSRPWRAELRALYTAWLARRDAVSRDIAGLLPADAVVINDTGSGWPDLDCSRPRRLLCSFAANTGYGLPAAIAAGLVWPERQIISFIDEAGFFKAATELDTARREKTHAVFVVLCGRQGTGDALRLAKAGGIVAEAASAAEFPSAFKRALAAGEPALMVLDRGT
jgi:acetolactate synthase-1/2/3 large subunit